MDTKDPDCVMLMIKTYGKLEHLEGLYTQLRYKGYGGELVNKQFNYCEVFGNHFNYIHQVDNNKNWRHYPILFDRNCATKYWPGRCHSYFLVLTEVNANYPRGYLVDRVYLDPQLDFWCQLVWEMVENTLYEETEAGGG